MRQLKIAVLMGGPSPERGISLNSARSVLDHLESDDVKIVPIYFDYQKKAYLISTAQLYSNTPSDFDFKLRRSAKALNETALLKLLKSVDLVFPAMHGVFGEDGQIQSYLKKNNIPFVGSPSQACRLAFDKFLANEFIKERGFFTLPSAAVAANTREGDKIILDFFKKYHIKRAIVKPASGGSSIGVFSVNSARAAIAKKNFLLQSGVYKKIVVEPFCVGKEFTVIIVQNTNGEPVAILPTEIETDYRNHQIFDYRKKYLPTNQVRYHYPPRFSDAIVNLIRKNAEEIFSELGMCDFARFDGWVLPNDKIWFSDFNPITGMEQNSFVFQQSSRIGLSHQNILRYIVKNACERYKIPFAFKVKNNAVAKRKVVNILLGGSNSERQVSLMSGSNVWLKLRKSKKYFPQPYFLDKQNQVWKLPYAYFINHTVEDITEQCKTAKSSFEKLDRLTRDVKKRLGLGADANPEDQMFLPAKMSLKEFIARSRYVFIGLHGGAGESGVLQKVLDKAGVKYNGSGPATSEICINKWTTGQFIRKINLPGVSISAQKLIKVKNFVKPAVLWRDLACALGEHIIVKPVADGCSTGIVKLNSGRDLEKYFKIMKSGQSFIPKNTFANQNNIIEMPSTSVRELLFEKCVDTDVVYVQNNKLIIQPKTGWIEVTVGVLEKNGRYHSLNPSLTIAESGVLSVEEKFQGGTGVNVTPPTEVATASAVLKVKKSLEKLCQILEIKDYARVDTFMHVKTGDLIIIEPNTLPALTPSTVIFHQALAETRPMFPTEFLEKIIENGGY